ncbi:unnamed protein product [Effrenium voratum]|nr:unnamed protein product [Effrenium voratum]
MDHVFVWGAVVGGLWALWLATALQTWRAHFSWRHSRRSLRSPSHDQQPPAPRKLGEGCPVLLGHKASVPASCPGTEGAKGSRRAGAGFQPMKKALDMNHVHLSLWQYLWAAHAIALPALFLVVQGWCQIQVARLLNFCCLLPKPSDTELRRMIYDLVLENLCTGVVGIEDTKSRVATFVYRIPVYLDSSSQVLMTRMVVKLNLSNADLVSAELDGETCTLDDAAVLLAHYVVNLNHPKIHAYANWGIDPADSTSRYLQKMSVVTASYNHYGFDNFPLMARNMVHKDAGLFVKVCLKESLSIGVPEHKLVTALAQHSKLLNFLIQLKMPFKQAFKQCKEDFPPSYSCEAHFLGTVVHSLDHWVFCQTIDPWLFSALNHSKDLQTLHSTVMLARCCALDDIPTVGLEKYFRDEHTEFHRMVYSAAKDLDASMADQIQTCIVK